VIAAEAENETIVAPPQMGHRPGKKISLHQDRNCRHDAGKTSQPPGIAYAARLHNRAGLIDHRLLAAFDDFKAALSARLQRSASPMAFTIRSCEGRDAKSF
jgi:hypothetical protein